MVYEPVSDQVFLFGGDASTRSPGDIWTFAYGTDNSWTELHPRDNPLKERGGYSLVYDSADASMIMFGGACGGENPGFLNDTWTYDPVSNTWREVHPAGDGPCPRRDHAAVWVPDTGTMILFGGWDGVQAFDDTWVYEPQSNTWSEVHPAGQSPPARICTQMVWDPSANQAILFGGAALGGSLDDTWTFDVGSSTWTELDPAGDLPPARESHLMVYDSSADKAYLLGGWGPPSESVDVWSYDSKSRAWAELRPAGESPPARSDFSGVYDPVTDSILLFGGWREGTLLDDLWVYPGSP